MAKTTIRDLDLNGKRVLVRVDFNVPLEQQEGTSVITDDTRIRAALPTLQFLRENGAKTILLSHLGRPQGKKNPTLSLKPLAPALAQLLGHPVGFMEDCIGPEVEKAVAALQPGEVLLLENTRFYPEETANDATFAQSLASLADVYVNDAFGSAHRAHASTEGVAHRVAQKAIGFLIEKELHFLGKELETPARPFVFILGGAKVSDKINVIENMLTKADTLLIGGGMAYTFALAQGRQIGNSLCEPDKIDLARTILEKAQKQGVKLLLPVDNLIVEQLDFANKTTSQGRYIEPGEAIPEGWEGVDIGPRTIEKYVAEIAQAKTILWNGPMGVFEIPSCAQGTFTLAKAIAQNTEAKTIIGGGDSVKAIKQSGYSDQVTFMSTGGGASLEFIEGRTLPGIAIIPDQPSTN